MFKNIDWWCYRKKRKKKIGIRYNTPDCNELVYNYFLKSDGCTTHDEIHHTGTTTIQTTGGVKSLELVFRNKTNARPPAVIYSGSFTLISPCRVLNSSCSSRGDCFPPNAKKKLMKQFHLNYHLIKTRVQNSHADVDTLGNINRPELCRESFKAN